MKEKKKTVGIVIVMIVLLLSITIVPIEASNISQTEKTTSEYPTCIPLWEWWKTIIFDDITIMKCWEYSEDENVRNQLVNLKTDTKNLIDNTFPSLSSNMYDVFDIDTAFELENIIGQIQKLRVGHVVTDVQSLLCQPKKESDMNIHKGNIQQLLSVWKKDNGIVGDYPLIDEICYSIGQISRYWIIPLVSLFGIIDGLVIGNFITLVFFSLIIIPMWVYLACSNAIESNPILKETLKNMNGNELLTEGVDLLMEEVYKGGHLLIGGVYILGRIITSEFEEDDNIISYSETIPFISSSSVPDMVLIDEYFDVSFFVKDYDFLDGSDERPYRDWVQIGIDWENDGVIDSWSELVKQNKQDVIGTKFNFNHIFKESGSHYIKVTPRDSLGVCGITRTYTINVIKPRTVFLFDFPVLTRLLSRFSFLFN